MTATVTARLDKAGPPVPMRGTLPMAANTILFKEALVSRNAAGNAVAPTDGDGLPVMGYANATYDNRTGSVAGGLAGDLDADMCYGVIALDYTGTAPLPGEMCYAVDNKTVSRDSVGGTRGKAGPCTEVRNSKAYVWVGPHVPGVAASGPAFIAIPLTSLRLSTGAAVPAFADGSADGFQLTDSEALSLRINDDSTTVFTCSVDLPANLDDATDLVLHVLGFRVGSADTADVGLTVGAFFHTVGAAHTADANAGGETTPFTAATTIVSEETLTIAAADIPAMPCSLTLTFTVTSELDGDDLCLTRFWLVGGAK
jgi:hypothetical protein